MRERSAFKLRVVMSSYYGKGEGQRNAEDGRATERAHPVDDNTTTRGIYEAQ